MKFAKYTFYAAGIYGLIALVPQYFLEEKTGRDFPPAITHPEYFYGFIGVAIAWQIAFFIIGRNPSKYRAMMIPAMLEKFGFVVAVYALYVFGRVNTMMVGAATVDLILGILFVVSFLKTEKG